MSDPAGIVHALYRGFFERGIEYFFPRARLETVTGLAQARHALNLTTQTDGTLHVEWMDTCYRMAQPGGPFTENQMRLVAAIGGMLSARYRSIFQAVSAGATSALFEGLPEDRFVSVFLDHRAYLDEDSVPVGRDVVADAIEVLREGSLITYENRRVSTGVLLLGDQNDLRHEAPAGAQPYAKHLISIKSFHRLCDGLKTVFLVNSDGLLVDLVDITRWSAERDGTPLPVPSQKRYHPHCRATLHGGNICLVLSPNGEIKIFAEGAQLFSFLEGRWRLTDAAEKYHAWRQAVGHAALAERLYVVALNLAEHRRGALFVVLDDAAAAASIVSPDDLLENACSDTRKARIHYLLRHKRVLDLEPSMIESIARMDGGIVMDRESNLLAFGAILHAAEAMQAPSASEGGRTTAAVEASRHGNVLKISEDGMLAFYANGAAVWEI